MIIPKTRVKDLNFLDVQFLFDKGNMFYTPLSFRCVWLSSGLSREFVLVLLLTLSKIGFVVLWKKRGNSIIPMLIHSRLI